VHILHIPCCPFHFILKAFAVWCSQCCFLQFLDELSANEIPTNLKVGLGYWDGWVVKGGTGSGDRLGILFGSAVAIHIVLFC